MVVRGELRKGGTIMRVNELVGPTGPIDHWRKELDIMSCSPSPRFSMKCLPTPLFLWGIYFEPLSGRFVKFECNDHWATRPRRCSTPRQLMDFRRGCPLSTAGSILLPRNLNGSECRTCILYHNLGCTGQTGGLQSSIALPGPPWYY